MHRQGHNPATVILIQGRPLRRGSASRDDLFQAEFPEYYGTFARSGDGAAPSLQQRISGSIPAFPPHKDPPKATGDPCQIRHSGPDFAARPRRQRISLPWRESLVSARAGTMEPWVAVCLPEPRLRSPGPRVEASDLPQENNITPSPCLSIWGAKRIRNHGRAWCCVWPGELRRGPSSPLRSIVLSSPRVDGSVIRVIPMSRTGPAMLFCPFV